MVDDRGARSRSLSFLRGNVLQRMFVIDLDPVSEKQRFLVQVPLDFIGERALPRAANGEVQSQRRRGDDERERRPKLEEDSLPHLGPSKR